MNTVTAFFGILHDRWIWRKQIVHLALFDLMKQTRGAMFSWAWLLVKPSVYFICFWVALGLGLRGGGSATALGLPPYILWLCSGIIPWFFMQEMLSSGADLFRKYRYLVNKIAFPLPCITSMFTVASMWVQLGLCLLLLLVYFLCKMPVDAYLLQLPVLLLLMLTFWDFASMMLSMLGAISRDLRFFVSALATPLFWVSGVIFHVDNLPFGVGRVLRAVNPITFFIGGFRDALYYKKWCFSDPPVTLGFVVVFVATVFFCAFVYARYNGELRDVL